MNSQPNLSPAFIARSVQEKPTYRDALSMVLALNPEMAVFCMRPHMLAAKAREFLLGFPGRVLYVVKANPMQEVIHSLFEAGLRDYDTSSLNEIASVSESSYANNSYFMHPVKARGDIRAAYHLYNVRHFMVDHPEELAKIRQETDYAKDLTLLVRITTPPASAMYNGARLFGTSVAEAAALITTIRHLGYGVGVSFHSGSQCMRPSAFIDAFEQVAEASNGLSDLKVIAVGGGFPLAYQGLLPPPLADYFAAIGTASESWRKNGTEIWCETGRGMVGSAASVVVRVELRRGQVLCINDGLFGTLHDLSYARFVPPMRALRANGADFSDEKTPFSFYGPTCNSTDLLPGPYMLPSDIREGDWIEIGQMGAYSMAMRSQFNGFQTQKTVFLEDWGLQPDE
ncbi:MAG: type III PLP-dependent enzyme [Alphaproteobacteria bacterium]